MNLDDLEEKFGGTSLYQTVVIVLTCTAVFGTSMMSQSAVIYSAVPDHRCALNQLVDEEKDFNFTDNDIVARMIPEGDSCHRFNYNISSCIEHSNLSCILNQTDGTIIKCDKGYVYDQTFFKQTTITEWNLVCDRTTLDTMANSIYFAGVFTGSMVFGPAMDRFGRKYMILFTGLMFFTFGISASFVKSYAFYIVLRFAVGMAGVPCFVACFTYVSEISGKKSRGFFSPFPHVTSSIGHATLPAIAYFTREWRDANIIFSCLSLPYIIFSFFLPRSPRWLLAHGEESEAKKVIKRYARSKKTKLDDHDWDKVVENSKMILENSSKKNKINIKNFFKSPCLRAVSVITICLWFVIGMVFYGLTLNIGTLAGDPYVNRALNAIVEIIGCLAYGILIRMFGRRISTCLTYSLSGSCCILSMIFAQFSYERAALLQISRWVGILGKLFATMGFSCVYLYTAELFPTSARGTGMGMGSTSARIGTIIMPWTLELQMHVPWLTQAIFGTLGLLTGASCMLLPETKDDELMTTLEQAEDIYKRRMTIFRKYFTFRSVNSTKDQKNVNLKQEDSLI